SRIRADVELLAVMVHVVLVLRLARRDQGGHSGGLVGGQEAGLARRQAGGRGEQIRLAARARHPEAEPRGRLLAQERVLGSANLVAIEPVRALGGVLDDIKEGSVVGRPGDAARLLDALRVELARAQILDVERIFAEPGRVEGVSEQIAVIAYLV